MGSVLFCVCRWYSEEYDWFYVDNAASGYILHVPPFGTGDAGDALNTVGATSNGKPFLTSGVCFNLYGPWWYTQPNYCSGCRLFGSAVNGIGFGWWGNPSSLAVSRMMIRLVT
jgi:hypothetical protein